MRHEPTSGHELSSPRPPRCPRGPEARAWLRKLVVDYGLDDRLEEGVAIVGAADGNYTKIPTTFGWAKT